MDSTKTYIDAQQLLDDSFALGLKILESEFLPDYIQSFLCTRHLLDRR